MPYMLFTISIASEFLGFFMLYNTSRKAKLSVTGVFEKWLQQHVTFARTTGLLLIVWAFILLAIKQGVAVGIITAFVLLMAAGSLIVMIAPFHYLRLKHVAAIVVGCSLLEYLFF